jgi:hypothetical protein
MAGRQVSSCARLPFLMGYIHRRGAKNAVRLRRILFTAERAANENRQPFMWWNLHPDLMVCPKGCVFHFLASLQKVKGEIYSAAFAPRA